MAIAPLGELVRKPAPAENTERWSSAPADDKLGSDGSCGTEKDAGTRFHGKGPSSGVESFSASQLVPLRVSEEFSSWSAGTAIFFEPVRLPISFEWRHELSVGHTLLHLCFCIGRLSHQGEISGGPPEPPNVAGSRGERRGFRASGLSSFKTSLVSQRNTVKQHTYVYDIHTVRIC